MQKDEKFYTFLLSHSSKTKISIRRIRISRKLTHTCAASFVFVTLTAFGIFGFSQLNTAILAKSISPIPAAEVSFSRPNTNNPAETRSFDYSRPDSQKAYHSGGPKSVDFSLTNEAEESPEQMESSLRDIETRSNPENLPTVWAHLGKINEQFGPRRNPFGGGGVEFHPGLDIDGQKGDVVMAPASGTVVKAGWQGGYGNMIEVDHGNGLLTRYGHLSKIEVAIGDSITRGQEIGLIGSTGRSTGPHLHFEIRLGTKAINPLRFLPPLPAEFTTQ
jgi:murein DD-endopeptidase MepM/ murein hydrolase activator NlpD